MNLRMPLVGLVLTAFGLLLLFTVLPKEIPSPPPIVKQSVSGQDRAYSLVNSLATGFPRRDDLSRERRAAQNWIAEQFRQIGLAPQIQTFSEHIRKGKVSGLANVFAVVPGTDRPQDVLLVLAHYDIPPFVRQGAADDASGVGIVLELARCFSEVRPRRTMIFLASDSEEYGAMWGAFNFLRFSGDAPRLRAVLSLDFVNMGRMAGLSLRNMGINLGFLAGTALHLTALAVAWPRERPY